MFEPAPIIVTVRFGDADFAWLDGLRRDHFPPERNQVPAHATLFHHLPPSVAPELSQRLARLVREQPAPEARLASVMKLGRGTAFRLESPGLTAIRAELALAFEGLLTPQDKAGWRGHVTIQNKVSPAEAAALHAELSAGFAARPIVIAGLATWYYRGGPWEPLACYAFSRSARRPSS